MLAQDRAQGIDRHRAVDAKMRVLIGVHAIREIIDQIAMRFQHQGDELFLTFQRQRGFAPAVEFVPRMRASQPDNVETVCDQVQVGL